MAYNPPTDNQGIRWDHKIVRGTTWGPHTITVKDDDSPVNLTGGSVYGYVLVGTEIVLTASTVVTDAVNGVFTAELTDEQTLSLPKASGFLVLGFVDSLGRTVELTRGSVETITGPEVV